MKIRGVTQDNFNKEAVLQNPPQKNPSTCYTKYDNGKVELQPPADRDKCRIPPSLKVVHFTIEV